MVHKGSDVSIGTQLEEANYRNNWLIQSSNAKAIKNAIGQAIKFTETGVIEKISASLSEIKEAKE